MIVLQWVIGCWYITLQTLLLLLRPLGRWFSSTILIKLMYTKARLVSQAYQWYTCWTSLWKKTKDLSYIHHGAFATYVEINENSSSTEVIMEKCGGCCEEFLLDMQTLKKWGCEKAAVNELLRTGMVVGPAQVFTRYHEKDITRIRSHVHGEKSKLIKAS